MGLMHFKETVTSTGNTDIAKECRSSSHGGAEKPQCAQCGKKQWKGDRKTIRKPRNVKSSKEEKAETMGKKGQRLNEITEPPEEQWTGGFWKKWLEQSWSAEIDSASWRDDDWYTADSTS